VRRWHGYCSLANAISINKRGSASNLCMQDLAGLMIHVFLIKRILMEFDFHQSKPNFEQQSKGEQPLPKAKGAGI
jgi:hypothetical protein